MTPLVARLRRSLLGTACVLALAAVACGASGGAGGSAGTSGGTGTSSSAGVNVTVSGAVSGSSSQLSKDSADDSRCTASKLLKTYVMNMYPVINGKTYHVALLFGKFSGATTFTLPADAGAGITGYIADAKTGDLWNIGTSTSGTIKVEDSGSGSMDLKNLQAMVSGTTVDTLKVTWTC